jgi:hypothetical protein
MKGIRGSKYWAFAVVVLLGCTCIALQSPTRNRRSITEDLSQGPSFKFAINAKLPDYTFKIVPDVQPTDEYGNAHSTVRDILVFEGDSDRPSQHLTGCELNEAEAPPRNRPWFRAIDFNFDGYSDIFLLTGWGATGNESGCVWLFDPATKTFTYSEEFSKLGHYRLDPATKTILSFERGGMVGMVHSAQRFKVEKNHLVLIFEENQDWDEDRKMFHCVQQERRGVNMVTTLDKWWAGEDDGKSDPCTASRFWQ